MARFLTNQCQTVVAGLDHPECVAVGSKGQLYAGGEAGTLYRIDPERGDVVELARALGECGGIALDFDDNLYECNLSGHVNRISFDGELSVYSTGTADLPSHFPNFPVFDQHGNLFFTDSGDWTMLNGRVYVVRPTGETEVAIADYLAFPNGLALDIEAGMLYIVQSTARNVVRVRVAAGNVLTRPEIYAEFPQYTVPDGLALAAGGNLYVACYEPNAIYIVEPSGRVEPLVEGLAFGVLNRPTNCAFSRQDDVLYWPNYGTGEIVRLSVGERGMPLSYPQLPST